MIIFDAHLHARRPIDPEFTESVKTYAALSGAVYMMNFPEPLDLSDTKKAIKFCIDYVDAIKNTAREVNPGHSPFIMPVLNKTMEPKQLDKFISAAHNLPLAGFKLFCPGQSTNAGYAPPIDEAPALIDVIAAHKKPIVFHLEDPEELNASKKEAAAVKRILPIYIDRNGRQIDTNISIEHFTTIEAIEEIDRRGIYGTITAHHPALAQEDIGIADPAKAETILSASFPYFFCKPIMQTRKNVEAIRQAWLSGHPRIMLGTDNAPHIRSKKEAATPAAGIFMGDARNAYRTAFGFTSEVDKLILKYSQTAVDFYKINPKNLCDPALPMEHHLKELVNVRPLIQERFKTNTR